MIRYSSFHYPEILCLFLTVSVIWCFYEPCQTDSQCSKYRLECHTNRCLCPLNSFWSGQQDQCIPCPATWTNLLISCIYFDNQVHTWYAARNVCHQLSTSTKMGTRLLEITDLDEYYFFKASSEYIFPDDQMKVELDNDNEPLYSAIAFVGSQGTGRFDTNWTYYWDENSNDTYTDSSPMWCGEKWWGSKFYPAEPATEQVKNTNMTYQALKQWGHTDDTCLISLDHTSAQSFLCEIIGESERFHNLSWQSLSSSLRTVMSLMSTTLLSSEQSSTEYSNSETEVSPLNTTDFESMIKKNQLFMLIIIGGIGVLIILAVIAIILVCRSHKRDSAAKDSKSATRHLTLKRTSKSGEETQSNDSFDTRSSMGSISQQSDKKLRGFNDSQSLATSISATSASTKDTKAMLWNEMESSLLSSTTQNPQQRESPKQNNKIV